MTTTNELDDFFDFDQAVASVPVAAGLHGNSHDSNWQSLVPVHDNSILPSPPALHLTSVQDYVDPSLPNQSFRLPSAEHDITWTPDLDKYRSWTNGASQACQPCRNCQESGLECVAANSQNDNPGFGGTCMSCVALSKQCDIFTSDMLKVGDFDESFTVPTSWRSSSEFSAEHSRRGSPGLQNLGYQTPSPQQSPSLPPQVGSGRPSEFNKVGSRFPREAIRILRHWATAHSAHPYPTEEEKGILGRKTGLSKTQITNWLANARRRGLLKTTMFRDSSTADSASPINAKQHTALSSAGMGPMERWQCLPPEHEPASVAAIARAVTSAHILSSESPPSQYPGSENDSVPSRAKGSSASSVNTGQSSGASLGSRFSNQSRTSFGSFGRGGRRRRRHILRATDVGKSRTVVTRPYHCTFCTDAFKTKHDWQRHEKSLHISLEKWICAPEGGICRRNVGYAVCSFCGTADPSDSHLENHNYNACLDRSQDERTFYRKDHLRQHLRLVHNGCSFVSSLMDSWKNESPRVRSRCGFCDKIMQSWQARIDHLAEHFKCGVGMSQWKGDWGFDEDIANMVENATLPHLVQSISDGNGVLANRTSARLILFDTLKLKIQRYAEEQLQLGRNPSTDLQQTMQDALRAGNIDQIYEASWLMDLIMCDTQGKWLENLIQHSKIARDSFPRETCTLEAALLEYITSQQRLGLIPTDKELQQACSHILTNFDEIYSKVKSKIAIPLIKELMSRNTEWLAGIRQRTGLPFKQYIGRKQPTLGPSPDDGNVDNCMRLQKELTDYTRNQLEMGIIPSDSALQTQARMILFGVDDYWSRTAVDDSAWLAHFKDSNNLVGADGPDNFVPPIIQRFNPHNSFFHGYNLQNHQHTATFVEDFINTEDRLRDFRLSQGLPGSNQSLVTQDSIFRTGALGSDDYTPLASELHTPKIGSTTIEHGTAIPRDTFQPHTSAFTEFVPEHQIRMATYVKQSLQQGYCPCDKDLRMMSRAIKGEMSTMLDDPAILGQFKEACGIGRNPGVGYGLFAYAYAVTMDTWI